MREFYDALTERAATAAAPDPGDTLLLDGRPVLVLLPRIPGRRRLPRPCAGTAPAGRRPGASWSAPSRWPGRRWFLLAVPLAALAVLVGWMSESKRREVQRRNDRALGRQVPARCPVPGRRTCIRSGCLHWAGPPAAATHAGRRHDAAGVRHPVALPAAPALVATAAVWIPAPVDELKTVGSYAMMAAMSYVTSRPGRPDRGRAADRYHGSKGIVARYAIEAGMRQALDSAAARDAARVAQARRGGARMMRLIL